MGDILMKIVTVKEASEILEVSPNTVRAWADGDKLKSRRHPCNGYRLFKRPDVIKLRDKINGASLRR